MISDDLLKKFCGDEDEPRYHLHAPFNYEGKTYATNGHIMVRVDARPCFDVGPVKMAPDAAKLFADNPPRRLGPIPDWNRSLAYDHECMSCNGTGKVTDEDDLIHDCRGRDNGKITTYNGVVFDKVKIATRYLRLMELLPGVLIDTSGEEMAVVPFVFDGGEGLCMPMRQDV